MSDPANSVPPRSDPSAVPGAAVMPWQEQQDPFGRSKAVAASSPCHAIHTKPLPAGALPCTRPSVADPTSLAPIALTIAAGICLGGGVVIARRKGRVPTGRRTSRTAHRNAWRWRMIAWLLILAAIGFVVLIAADDLPFA